MVRCTSISKCYLFMGVLFVILYAQFLYTHNSFHDLLTIIPNTELDYITDNNSVKDAAATVSNSDPPTQDGVLFTPSSTSLKLNRDRQSRKPSGSSHPNQLVEANNFTSKFKSVNITKQEKPNQFSLLLNTTGLARLNSSLTLKLFKRCAGKLILQWSHKKEGVMHIPKHFQTCKNMTFQKTGDSVALISVPGSGNSWVRQLLETTTGIYTGALYCDPSYVVHAGMLGEGITTQNVLIVKDHCFKKEQGCFTEKSKLPKKILYIVRNPFDAFLSEWNRQLAYKLHPSQQHTGSVSNIKDFAAAKDWEDKVKEFSSLWEHHVQKWIGQKKVSTLVVQYERLSTDLYTELKRMVDFIGVPYTESDLQCTINSNSETFHRKHDHHLDPFTKTQRQLFHQKIHLANKTLQPYNITY